MKSPNSVVPAAGRRVQCAAELGLVSPVSSLNRGVHRGLIALATCLAVAWPVPALPEPPVPPAPIVLPRAASPAPAEATARPAAARRPAQTVEVPAWLLVYRLTDPSQDDSWRLPDIIDPLPDWRGASEPVALPISGSADDQDASDLKTLLVKGERWHLLSFDGVASSGALDTKVTAFGKIPHQLRDADDTVAPADSYAPALLGVKGEMAGFELGAQYRSLGKNLGQVASAPWAKKDLEGSEVWVARRFGVVGLRLSQSDLSDNVDRNPALPRTTKSQTALAAEVTVPAGPVLSVAYGTGAAQRDGPTGQGRTRDQQNFYSVTGSAYYFARKWDATAATTYVLSRDAVGGDNETASLYYYVSLTLRPIEAFTLTPALSAGSDRDTGSRTRSNNGWASLTLSYSPPASRWSTWSTLAYGGAGSDGGRTESSGMSLSGGLALDLWRVGPLRSTVSAEAGYDRYQDRAASVNSSRGAYALVLFKVTGF